MVNGSVVYISIKGLCVLCSCSYCFAIPVTDVGLRSMYWGNFEIFLLQIRAKGDNEFFKNDSKDNKKANKQKSNVYSLEVWAIKSLPNNIPSPPILVLRWPVCWQDVTVRSQTKPTHLFQLHAFQMQQNFPSPSWTKPILSFCFRFPWVQCCFTSTEPLRTVRDGESRTATLTFRFTQLLSSEDFHKAHCGLWTQSCEFALNSQCGITAPSECQIILVVTHSVALGSLPLPLPPGISGPTSTSFADS